MSGEVSLETLPTPALVVDAAITRINLRRIAEYTVATRFPECKIVLAHLEHPYEGECVVVIRKHPNVYADVSALYYRPWQLYHSLMLVQEYGVWHKLLFGTDYPFTTVNDTLAGLRRLNDMIEEARLPRPSATEIEALNYRDGTALLGL